MALLAWPCLSLLSLPRQCGSRSGAAVALARTLLVILSLHGWAQLIVLPGDTSLLQRQESAWRTSTWILSFFHYLLLLFLAQVFFLHLPPLHFLSCLCENVKGARPQLSPGRSFELFCLHSAIPKGLHSQRGSSQGWRLSMNVDMAQWFLHLAWSAVLSCEPQAAVTALRGAPRLSRGHRDGGED